MTTAFVLSGGGSLGAVQVGMLQALADRHVMPDLLVGASAGAINAAFVAGRGFRDEALAELSHIWRGLRRHDVFPFAPTRQLLALAGARPSLCSPDGLRRLIEAHLTYDRLEDASIPVHVVADEGGPQRPHPERFLSLHTHRDPTPTAREDTPREHHRKTRSSPTYP